MADIEARLGRFHDLDMVVICGLPSSGKSYFAKKYMNDGIRRRVNRKEIRRLVYEMMHFGEKWHEDMYEHHDEHLVKHVERKILDHLIHRNEKILVDNVSVSPDSRRAYVELAHRAHKSIGAIYLNTALQVCLQRNAGATDQVPSAAISTLYAHSRTPDRAEGFDEVMVIETTLESAKAEGSLPDSD